jgi:hypothetical protein
VVQVPALQACQSALEPDCAEMKLDCFGGAPEVRSGVG